METALKRAGFRSAARNATRGALLPEGFRPKHRPGRSIGGTMATADDTAEITARVLPATSRD